MELIKLTRQDLRYIVNESVKKAITEANSGKQLNLDTLVAYLSMPYQQKALNNALQHFDDYCTYLSVVKKIRVRPSRKAAAEYQQYAVEYTDRLLNAVSHRSPYILNGDIDVRWQNSNLFFEYLGRTSGWFVHFTNRPRDIVEQGFLGLQDINSIHRTFGSVANRQLNSGYAFAYDANTLKDTDFSLNTYYVVFFQGEGIVARNIMDEDEQVIFDAASVDHTNVVVGKLSKNLEHDYDGNGDVDTTATISGLQFIYPASVKGMSFANVREAFSWLQENGTPDMTQQSGNKDVEAIIDNRYSKLIDLNDAITVFLAKKLKLNFNIQHTTDFLAKESYTHDYRDRFSYKHPETLPKANVYSQVFNDRMPFNPNVSILDLLFNLGPETKDYLLSIDLETE